MYSKILCYLQIIFILLAGGIDSHSVPFFRKDYKYLPGQESFYKIHTLQTTWQNSRARCAMEGATFFYPENEAEVRDVISYWNDKQPGFHWVYIGISDLISKGAFVTFNGIPVDAVYNQWAPGEPNNYNNEEDCLMLKKDGKLNDTPCGHNYPSICKKTLASLEWNTFCNVPDSRYLYTQETGKCYKVHLKAKSWVDAYRVCYAEQSYLAVINSQKEADHVVELFKNAKKLNASELYAHIGLHNGDGDWKTVDDEYVEESGYEEWEASEPEVEKHCGSISLNGKLKAVDCETKAYFICEHDIGPLNTLDGGHNYTDV